MPSGHKVNGVDLDDIFDPYVQGTKPANTGYQVAGVDLKDRYAPIVFGASAPATNMFKAGFDLNTIFAAKGTAVYPGLVDPPGYSGLTFVHSRTSLGSPATAGRRFKMESDGGWSTDTILGTLSNSGSWYNPNAAGVGAGYNVRYTVTQTSGSGSGVTITNPAASFVALSSDRQLTVQVVQSVAGARFDLFSVRVELQDAGTLVTVLDDTFVIDLNAEYNN